MGGGGLWGEAVGVERGYIRTLHILADLKSRHDLTAYLVREKPNPKALLVRTLQAGLGGFLH